MSQDDELFASLTAVLEIDEHISEREEMRARAQAFRAAADALDALADDLGKSHDERDVKIRPEHFARIGDSIAFLAPESERSKMRSFLANLRAGSHFAAITLRRLEDASLEGLEIVSDDEDIELPEPDFQAAILDGVRDQVRRTIPDISTVDTVIASIDCRELSMTQARAWRTLFATLSAGLESSDEESEDLAEFRDLIAALDKFLS